MNLTPQALAALACPICLSELSREGKELVCVGCRNHFRISDGIIDFCSGEVQLPGLFADDWQRSRILRARSNQLSIAQLIRLCYELPGIRSPANLDATVDHMLRGENRMQDALASFDGLAGQSGWSLPKRGAALDLGCGAGTGAVHLAKRFDRVFAVNPAWDEMVVAERVNSQWCGGGICLLRAPGEQLPFQDNTFDLVCALDVIEHVVAPMNFLKEAERVLKPGGLLIFNSPNQYNMISPDPHVHVKYVGFIPERFRECYVRWRSGGMPWVMRNVHPVSYRRLNGYLKRLKHSDFCFRTLVLTGTGKTWKGKLVRRVLGMGFLLKWFFLLFGSVHEVVVRKARSASRSSGERA